MRTRFRRFLWGGGGKRRLFLTVLALMAFPAYAITTQSFQVNATIVPGCSVTTGSGAAMGNLNFGSYSGVENRQVNAQFVPNAALALACTPGVALSMTVDGGRYYGTVRNMQRDGGTQRVGYRLYRTASLAANSEIGVNQPVSVTYTNSNNIALPLFGVAFLTGFSPAGNYSDQLTVTLSW
ncbi:spore coat protein U domain-containing protein [Citrobacter sedlakii]|uniref:Spore coat protein U domain-containing protein n=2 Tax=Enterobacteriaceae TaxID=543 RepID=A0ABS0ZP96_9ENTR|nr:spore coat protein U domain-containing protein [Citrobacter sedlakii]QMK45766.1 spore coat protein U domain-containing protein [Citrobacter sp. RHB21-C05]QMK64209.1 spore coat protein U domain-containing protein [Citrobacter sp. RHB21-C01]EHG7614404.1 spore coat protein U domain-containing protein [Citrobacter sedlakii]EIQ7156625.1 spore coat protein U domain-containing protein [Citrobacter sedlakii]